MQQTIVPFEEFEQDVMRKILEEETSINKVLREQYRMAEVMSREFTGAGFFTELKVPETIASVTEPVEYGCGDVWASINNSDVLFGFVLFIENGTMTCLEGFMCADVWPEEIYHCQLYHFDEAREITIKR